MKNVKAQAMPAPPSLMGSLMAGFDATANHIGLLLLPVSLDLLLWFGPHLRLDHLIQRMVTDMRDQAGVSNREMADLVQFSSQFWSILVERLNFFSILRTYPVGIPSLMVTSQPLTTPLGEPVSWQVPSLGVAALLWILFTLIGLGLGAFYFGMIAQVIAAEKLSVPQILTGWLKTTKRTILLALLLAIFMVALSVPASCLISLAAMGALPLGQIGLWIFAGIALWILLPFAFAPHGVFLYQSRVLISLRDSIRITRATMAKTVLFFIILLVLDEGLSILWQIPGEDSWLALVGLFGHAFIATGLIAASFVYYRDANRWLQRLIQQSALLSSA